MRTNEINIFDFEGNKGKENQEEESRFSSSHFERPQNTIDIHKFNYQARADKEKTYARKGKVSTAILKEIRDFLSNNHKKLFQESIVDRKKRNNIGAVITEYISQQKIFVPGYSVDELIKYIVDALAGLDVLEPLLDDEKITDINVNGPKQIWVDHLEKGYYLTDIKFSNEEQLYSVAMKIANASGQQLTSAKPYADCFFPGMRINIVTHHICNLGISLDIRKFAKTVRINDRSILETKQANEEMLKAIEAFVRSKLNILIAGPTGSGKTELAKYMIKHIPQKDRLIMLEDTPEMRLEELYPDKHIVPMQCRFTDDESTTIDYIKLLKNSLRKNPTRIGVGEVRGEEAVYMIEIFNTGHDGGFSTGHASSAADMVKRLVQMCLRSGMDLNSNVIGEWVTSTFDIVIFQERMEDGVRRIKEICELVDYKNDKPITNTLYELETGKYYRENGEIKHIECKHVQKGFVELETAKKLKRVEHSLFKNLVRDEDKEVLGIE